MATAEQERTTDGRQEMPSIGSLIKELRDDVTLLMRQEIALAKAELSENAARGGRNVAYLGIGVFLAFLGLIFVLHGVSALVSAGLMAAGLAETTALWLGPLIVGLTIAIVGCLLTMKAIRTFTGGSLLPRKTMESLREDKRFLQEKM